MSVTLPAHLEWDVWRVASSGKYGTLAEIERDWSLVDLVNAHDTMDLLEEAQAKGGKGKP